MDESEKRQCLNVSMRHRDNDETYNPILFSGSAANLLYVLKWKNGQAQMVIAE